MIIRGNFMYKCSAGETYDSVSLRVYGNEKYAYALLGANPALSDRMVFTGGEKIKVPALQVTESTDEQTSAQTTAPWR